MDGRDVPPAEAGQAEAGPAEAGPAEAGPAEAGPAARRPLGGAQGRRLAGERLRQAILAGDMAPGQRLVEEEQGLPGLLPRHLAF